MPERKRPTGARPMPDRFSRLIPLAALSLACCAAIGWGLWAYPLPAWPLAVALLIYAGCLWRWPALFLIVVPAALPALDLGTWTGWTMAGESDLFILATAAILLIREPPDRGDLLPRRWAGAILLLLVVSFAISTTIGLATPATGAAGSSNPYLRPGNAVRLAKPLAEVLLLLPFMRRRHRVHGDLAIWLGRGMLAGAAAVAAETIAERAVFPGLFNFATDYRVAAAFSSMHVGGGHIGAYVAMTLPFLLGVCLTARRWYAVPSLFVVAVGAGYTLVVTFARTAYAAALISIVLTVSAWLSLTRRAMTSPARRVLGILIIVPVLGCLVAGASLGFMRERLHDAARDLLEREASWRHFREVRDNNPLHLVFGAGLGTYPRLNLARGTSDRPSDFRLEGSGADRYLTIDALTPLFIGQKITLPLSSQLHATLRWRAATANAGAGVVVCEKLLLYSDNCEGKTFSARDPRSWETISADIPLAGLGQTKVLGWLRRPVEFAVFSTVPGTEIAVRELSLVDDFGWQVLANGDFHDGMNRWLFTDDSHVAWRMFSLYVMLLFETGLFGLASFLAVAGLAIGGGARALRRGEAMGAAVIGSVVSFLISGVFDNVMEAPRLATVFLLVCATGLILWEWDAEAWDGGSVLPPEMASGEIESL
jgi:O-antigen ligase